MFCVFILLPSLDEAWSSSSNWNIVYLYADGRKYRPYRPYNYWINSFYLCFSPDAFTVGWTKIVKLTGNYVFIRNLKYSSTYGWGLPVLSKKTLQRVGKMSPFFIDEFSHDSVPLSHVQRVCYGIASPPTSIVYLTWLTDKLEWIVHKCLLSNTATFLSGDLMRRI